MYSPSITLTFFNLALRPQKKDLPFPVSAAFVSANQIFVALPYSTLPSPHALHLNWCLSSSASRSSAMPRPPDRTLTTGYGVWGATEQKTGLRNDRYSSSGASGLREGATDHALLNPEVQTRSGQGS